MRPPLGLVGAGQVSRPLLSRIPALSDRLGPVVAPSQRLASRMVNLLRAGHPALKYEALREVRTVLVSVPDRLAPKFVAEMAAAGLDWSGKVVLLCGAALDSAELGPLAARGAATGSFGSSDGLEDLGFIAEGHRAAIRELRALMHHSGIRIHELRASRKALYLAGLSFGTTLFTPLLDASVQCLRDAGLKPGPAAALAERLFQKTLRAYLHGGRKARGARVATEDHAAIQRQIDALARANPGLARYFRRNLASALELVGLAP